MQTCLDGSLEHQPGIGEAEAILRRCVHCGFCNAACPTYRLTGDEADGPRGRIYLMKMLLEGENASGSLTRHHLDRCLTCRACETACPSGVRYGQLLDTGREVLEARLPRSGWPWFQRRVLRLLLPYPRRLSLGLSVAQWVRPFVPAAWREKIPRRIPAAPAARAAMLHPRRVILLEGCVQPVLAPGINAAARLVLDRLGITAVPVRGQGCCGALSYHLSAREEALGFMRRNIAAWWPLIEAGAEAIVTTASGCGLMVRDYGEALRHDPAWAGKAQRVSALARDIGEVLAGENLEALTMGADGRKLVFHAPCTLQHGAGLGGLVQDLLARLGFGLVVDADPRACCGSAGTYSLLEPGLASALRDTRLAALEAEGPDAIVTANIGCLAHLQAGTGTPVRHWVEVVAERLGVCRSTNP